MIEHWEYISRKDLRANPHKLFLFGDNLKQRGLGGQAREMRGEPNAVGIPTKKAPSMSHEAFFCDMEFERINRPAIDEAFEQVKLDGRDIVIPSAGLGTGLAELPTRAPITNAYILDWIGHLTNLHNNSRFGDERQDPRD